MWNSNKERVLVQGGSCKKNILDEKKAQLIGLRRRPGAARVGADITCCLSVQSPPPRREGGQLHDLRLILLFWPEQHDRMGKEHLAKDGQHGQRIGGARPSRYDHLPAWTQREVEPAEELRVGCRVLSDFSRERLDESTRSCFELRPAKEPAEAQQVRCHDRIARGQGAVIDLLPSQREVSVEVGRSEKETAVIFIPETADEILADVGRPREMAGFESRLVELDEPPDEEGVVVQKGRNRHFSFGRAMMESSLDRHPVPDKQGG